MQDADESVPFFWGVDSEGNLVLADEEETVKKGCGKSFAPFPKGIIIRLYIDPYFGKLFCHCLRFSFRTCLHVLNGIVSKIYGVTGKVDRTCPLEMSNEQGYIGKS